MNYAELPLDERIRMASDYALLLIEDSLNEESIVTGLQSQFFLTQEQALLALSRTRSVHKEAYNRSLNAAVLKAVASLFVSIVSATFYVAMGEEAGTFLILIGGFFLLSGLGAFALITQKILDRLFYSPTLIEKRLSKGDRDEPPRRDWTVNLFLGSFVLFAVATVLYLKQAGYEETRDVVTVHSLHLKRPPVRQSTGGDAERYYYLFQFAEYSNEFRFDESYYEYAGNNFQSQDFRVGDTLSVQVRSKDYYDKLYWHREGEVAVVNIINKNLPAIDLILRNQKVLRKNKVFFQAAALLIIVTFLFMLLRHKRAADKDKVAGIIRAHEIYL